MTVSAEQIKTLARNLGADLVGIASHASLVAGPPSADARYLLSSANSVISFAISLDRDRAEAFMSKQAWRPHCENRKEIVQQLYTIGEALAAKLIAAGHEAVPVEINNMYRPECGAGDLTEMTQFHPDFSHRYAALAAGIGRLGWSGNLLTVQYGALVELGSVLTSATLTPDIPLDDSEHPCDTCRICSTVCPVNMIPPKTATTVTVAGITETIAGKQPNTCCWIGCSGYHGLSQDKTWSNWSPYSLPRPLPTTKKEIDALCIELQKADPQMQEQGNSLLNYREAVFDPDWFYHTVCGFCRLVCMPDRKKRRINRQRIRASGRAALRGDGLHIPADETCRTIPTPFGLNVFATATPSPQPPEWPGQFPLDREVLRLLSLRDE